MNTTEQIEALTARLDALEATSFPAASTNTWWLLSNGILVFFMQCGFGMLEAGSVTARATTNILLKNLLDASISALSWFTIGYGLAFDGNNPLIGVAGPPTESGHANFLYFGVKMLNEDAEGFKSAASASGYAWALWFFHFTFAAASATIVSGAVAERAQLVSYVIYSTIISLFVYPIVVHWAWSEAGWLSTSNPDAVFGGVIDFAGAGVVHVTGGVAALCGAYTIGPRQGRLVTVEVPVDAQRGACTPCSSQHRREPMPMPGHSSVLQALGTFILWMGWYGFNAGSTLSITGTSTATAARIFVATTISASTGGLTVACLEHLLCKRWDVQRLCCGVLVGLVSITAGCATCPAWACIVIGAVGGCVYRGTSWLVIHKLNVDDPLDAFAVHAAGGAWGVLSCAIFSSDSYVSSAIRSPSSIPPDGGLLYGSARPLGAAVIFLLAVVVWVAATALPMFLLLNRLGVLRVSDNGTFHEPRATYHIGGQVTGLTGMSIHGAQMRPFGGAPAEQGGGSVAAGVGASLAQDHARSGGGVSSTSASASTIAVLTMSASAPAEEETIMVAPSAIKLQPSAVVKLQELPSGSGLGGEQRDVTISPTSSTADGGAASALEGSGKYGATPAEKP